MLFYAQSDTHFLLYIYDMLRNELIDKSVRGGSMDDFIEMTVQKSKEESLKRFEQLVYDSETGRGCGWFDPLSKSSELYDGEQFAVYRAVHKWRDDTARARDESIGFIMKGSIIADIARIMPTDKKALWSLINTNAGSLKVHLDELFDLIQRARKSGANGPRLIEVLKGIADCTSSKDTEIKPAPTLPDIAELKSDRTQLFGNIPISSRWEPAAKEKTIESEDMIVIQYPFPLQNADEIGDTTEQPPDDTEPSALVDAHQKKLQAELANQEFTLKSGRKRKIEDREAEAEAESDRAVDEMDVDDADRPPPGLDTPQAAEDGDRDAESGDEKANRERKLNQKARKEERATKEEADKRVEKALRKAEKRAKKAAKLQQQQAAASVEADEDEQPFDYTKAESVLHASKYANKNGGDAKHKRTFDPYGKQGDDAPKGARKLGHVKAGKTATFKK